MIAYNEELIYHMHRYPIKVILEALKDFDVRLICFGSTVKGTAYHRSDIDIAYLAKNPDDSKKVRRILSEIEWDEDFPYFPIDAINIAKLNENEATKEAIYSGMLLKDFAEIT